MKAILAIKYTIRNLLRNKVNTIINVIGLSLGITTFLLLILYVQHELFFDKQFSEYKNIYRVTTKLITSDGSQHVAFAPAALRTLLKNEFPAIKETGAVCEMTDQGIVEYDGNKFMQDGFREASPNIFNVLDYKAIKGNLSTALQEPNSVVLTRSLAQKIMGKKVDINHEIRINNKLYKVTAIIEDLPKNMDLQFTALLPGYREKETDWLDLGGGYLYVKFHSNISPNFENILSTIEKKYYVPIQDKLGEGIKIKFIPQKLSEIHFSNELLADSPKGNILYVYFFAVVAFIILIVACINFINLTLAKISERSYISGICKINGAGNYYLHYLQAFETLVIGFISLLISVVLVSVSIPYLNIITSKDIHPNTIISFNFLIIITLVFVAVMLIINGVPFFFSIMFGNKNSLQGLFKRNYTRSSGYRGGLVVMQFTFTIALIVCLIVFQRQMSYMKNKDLGFNLNNVLVVNTPFDTSYSSRIKLFHDQLKKIPAIEQTSFACGGTFPGNYLAGFKMLHASKINGEMKQFMINFSDIDQNYLKLLDIKLIKGENFSSNSKTNANRCIVNETYAKYLGIKDDPIGKTATNNDKIIGVVKDFHFLSPHHPIEAMCFRYSDGSPGYIFIKTKHNILQDLKIQWNKTIPDYPFIYSDLASSYNNQYLKDDNTYKIICFFAVLNILISCMGMIGLIRYTCDRRTKEIGIRKVNGAKISEVMTMLNKSFIKCVVTAFVIASPIAWYVMHKWLQDFAYKTELSWWVFALAGATAVTITVLTVSWQSWRAATRNPVEALRYE